MALHTELPVYRDTYNTISELEDEYQVKIYAFMILSILFLLNGSRILSRFYKDKIKSK